jgi:VanZ family protein
MHLMPLAQSRFKHATLWMTFGWVLVLAIVYLSLARDTITIPARFGDKYGHIAAYAAVMFWFMQLYATRGSRLLVAIALLALGIAIEFAQVWTGYRAFERADMLANGIGVAIGWLAGPPRTYNLLERIERLA